MFKKIMLIKKRFYDSILPSRATKESAGLDLYAHEVVRKGNILVVKTGVKTAIPKGHFGLLCARSSIVKTGLRLVNSIGIIDSDYRGEIILNFDIVNENLPLYAVGQRVAQIIITPYICPILMPSFKLDTTKRAEGGFGSTGQ